MPKPKPTGGDVKDNPALREHLHLVTEHYQKTYELNFELWKERNRLVLTLLAVIGVGALLTYQVAGTQTLMMSLIVHALDLNVTVDQFQKEFPFAIFQLILLVVILYLMVNLYQRTTYIMRNYKYLADVEEEIRACLKLSKADVAFSREGHYYHRAQTSLQKFGIQVAYVITLGLLLVVFLTKRISDDWAISRELALLEGVIGVFIAVFFIGYATYRPSIKPA
ncbi:MAG: hypothetical protein ABI835_09140 [Chloroflexota bacterium]